MKKVLFAIFCILCFSFDCRKDDIDIEMPHPPINTKTMELQIMFTSEADYTVPAVTFGIEEIGNIIIPAGGWMSGYSSITAVISPAESYFTLTDCSLDPAKNQIKSTYEGIITSKEGDSFNFKGEILTEISNSKFNGTLKLTGGTGKLSGISGTIHIFGITDFQTGEYTWCGGGEVEIHSSI